MHRLLLDTHVLIWLAEQPKKLSVAVRSAINSDNKLFVSHVSFWEMAIKIKTGKRTISFSLPEFMDKAIEKHSLEIMPIKVAHI